jgi:cell division protein FtsQ
MREIKNFDLVDEVSVRKIYPNKLSINILEKEPIMIFNQNDKYFIIDKKIDINLVESQTLEENDFFKNLIHLEANDIEKGNLIESLKVFFEEKNFINRVSAIYNVGGRRWNIILDRRIKVMLPEDINAKFIEKIFTLVDSLKSNGTIEHDALYVILDLRVKDKVFIKNINDH